MWIFDESKHQRKTKQVFERNETSKKVFYKKIIIRQDNYFQHITGRYTWRYLIVRRNINTHLI